MLISFVSAAQPETELPTLSSRNCIFSAPLPPSSKIAFRIAIRSSKSEMPNVVSSALASGPIPSMNSSAFAASYGSSGINPAYLPAYLRIADDSASVPFGVCKTGSIFHGNSPSVFI